MDSREASIGRTAVAAGVLMAAGVAGEWVLTPQERSGEIVNGPVFAVLVTTTTVGYLLLSMTARGLRDQTDRGTRPARTGSFMTMAGATLLGIFGVGVLVSSLVMGAPFEPLFLAFALGMLLLTIGPVMWGLSLRRGSGDRGVWQLLVLAGVSAFAAIAIPLDPWHDVSLMAMFASWSSVGIVLIRQARTQVSVAVGA